MNRNEDTCRKLGYLYLSIQNLSNISRSINVLVVLALVSAKHIVALKHDLQTIRYY